MSLLVDALSPLIRPYPFIQTCPLKRFVLSNSNHLKSPLLCGQGGGSRGSSAARSSIGCESL
jgi:hypothetical protein